MVDEGFSILPATAVPTSGLDLAKLANGRVVEARVASLADGIAIVSSRHGSLQVDVAAFGQRLPAIGDTVRLQVQAAEGGGRPTVTVVDDAAVTPAAVRVEDAVAVLARELRGAAASQTGLAPLYATLAGLERAPAGAVPEAVRALVTQIMGSRLGGGGPPDAAAVRKAFHGSGLFLETRLAAAPGARAGAGEDLKAALFSLRAALETWVGGRGSTAPAGEPRLAPPAGHPGGGGDPSGTMRPEAAAMRSAGAAYAGLGSRAFGRGTAGASDVAGVPGAAAPQRPMVGDPRGAVVAGVPVAAMATGSAPAANGAPPVTVATAVPADDPVAMTVTSAGPSAPRPAGGDPPAGAAVPTDAAVRSGPGRATGPAVRTPTATPDDGGGDGAGNDRPAPPNSAAPAFATVRTPLAGMAPPPAEVAADPLMAAVPSTGTSVAAARLPGSGVEGPTPTVGGTALPGDGDAVVAAGRTMAMPAAASAIAAAAGRDDGIAVLLAAVVKGLEAAGSLTASRPSEMGEAAAALAAIGPERELKPPPPRRGQAPRGQAALAADTVGADGVEGLGRRALERTEGALSRIVLEQFAALDRRNDDGAPSGEARATREWTVEMPIATAAGTGVVQMTVERGGGRGRDPAGAAKAGWRVRFSMDVEPLGPIHVQIGLSGEKLAIGLWAERPDAAVRLGDDVGRLQGALEAAAIPVESIHLAAGRPASGGPGPTAGRFVDVRL